MFKTIKLPSWDQLGLPNTTGRGLPFDLGNQHSEFES